MTDRGVAYQLWAEVENERLNRSWSAVEMAKSLGVARNTISNLRTSPHKPTPPTVHKVADGLAKLGVNIDRERAEQLAGLRPFAPTEGAGQVSVRDAVKADPVYTEEQRQAMLQLLDIFERANRGGEERQAG
ncbi:helix-turn-helix domain-containing protein [Micromonospora sp. NPDC051006]|uniref:helix-turn-helix domain-containing protein n=1 Tax=Micromonospora sp. NPDC051006 TaxID=3364283 RepID=UPI00378D2BE8